MYHKDMVAEDGSRFIPEVNGDVNCNKIDNICHVFPVRIDNSNPRAPALPGNEGQASSGQPPSYSAPSYVTVNETDQTNTTLFTFSVTDEGKTIGVEPNDAVTRKFVLVSVSVSNIGWIVTVMNIIPLDRDTIVTNSITLYLTDVNDNAPVFKDEPYTWYLKEDIKGSAMRHYKINATDYDSNANGRITFTMQSTNSAKEYNETFAINPTSGMVDQMKPLDYEKNSYYQFTVTATDGGSPPKSTTADFIIRVEDVQDTPPFFTGIPYRAIIDEGIVMGSNVLTVNAQDGDPGVSNNVNYTIEANGLNKNCSQLFQVNVTSGSVSTATVVDRESDAVTKVNGECKFNITGDNAKMCVQVLNANGANSTDFHAIPKEIQGDGNITLLVATGANKTLLDYERTKKVYLKATDEDDDGNGNLTYSLAGGMNKFRIDPDDGHIYTNCIASALNRELLDTYYMSLTVEDSGHRRSTAQLIVYLNDENDERPKFFQDTYYVTLVENDEKYINKSFVTVRAKDNDQINSSNSNISYCILTASDKNFVKNFNVNDQTGNISLNHAIDFENITNSTEPGLIVLTIQATDHGNPSLNSKATVRIIVQDVNDFYPIFEKDHYGASVHENESSTLQKEVFVTYVNASDGDGTERNRGINYFIESGSFGKFRIDPKSGKISVQIDAILDYDQVNNYTLTVMAIDQGSPALNSTCTVDIDIIDVNDVAPKFLKPSCKAGVTENTTSDNFITDCTAYDPDLDSDLVYNISSIDAFDETGNKVNSTPILSWFEIDNKRGNVSATNQTDREYAQKIELTILVEDMNAYHPAPQNDSVLLSINLLDVNDNKPEFSQQLYNASVSEKATTGTVVISTIQATDKDVNRTITFSLLPGEHPISSFYIDKKTGIISKVREIDREQNDSVILTIVARDNGVPSKNNTSEVYVDILDFNDNAPQFINLPYNRRISESVTVNKTVLKVSAYDRDEEMNSKVTYYIKSGSGVNFSINEITGEIIVQTPLDRETRSEYDIVVIAKDNPRDAAFQKTNETTVHISISDVNDNPPVFPQQPAIRILENIAINTTILTISATDADQENTNNSMLVYHVEDDNFNFFNISGNELYTQTDLRDHVGVYNVTVVANDLGDPQMSANTTIQVEVEDVNLHAPYFNNIPKGNILTLFEVYFF
ncbi:cadherin-23-like [Mya arenaria]|nr:cadherin-23-like [Mya arenaria]